MESQWVHGWLGSIYAFFRYSFFRFLLFPLLNLPRDVQGASGVERAGSGWGYYRVSCHVSCHVSRFRNVPRPIHAHTRTPAEEVLGFHALLLLGNRRVRFHSRRATESCTISGSLSVAGRLLAGCRPVAGRLLGPIARDNRDNYRAIPSSANRRREKERESGDRGSSTVATWCVKCRSIGREWALPSTRIARHYYIVNSILY